MQRAARPVGLSGQGNSLTHSDSSARELQLRAETVGDTNILVSPVGVLDSRSYLTLRAALLKAAAEQPRAVLVNVDRLVVPVASAWSVLTSAQWLVDDWPGVRICVLSTIPDVRRVLHHNGIARYLGIFSSVQAAVDAMATGAEAPHAHRLRVSQELPRHTASQGLARDLVRRSLTRWGHPEYIEAAETIATELVRNVLAHTRSAPRIRLECAAGQFTIAVADRSTRPAVRHEPVEGTNAFTGLGVVSELSNAWGSHPTNDGKVVWAVIGTRNSGRLRKT